MMRAVGIGLGLVLIFLFGGYVDHRYDWPFGLLDARRASSTVPLPGSNASTYIPRYSNAQGAEDAPRADVAQGARIDMQRCLNTMALRNVKPGYAEDTCRKLIAGISN